MKSLAIYIFIITCIFLAIYPSRVHAHAISGYEDKLLIDHDREVSSLSFSPNGKFMVSEIWDKKVKIWSMPDGSLVKNVLDMPKPSGRW